MFRFNLNVLLLMLAVSSALPAYSDDDTSKKLERAKKLIDIGRPQQAKVLLRQIVRTNPGSAEAHMQLGAALASLAVNDNYDEAIGEEQKAMQLDPKSPTARRILGMIYANQRKYDEAIAVLKEATTLAPSGFSVHRDLGTTYLSAGRIDDAIAIWKKASEINPTNTAIQMKIATTLFKNERYAEATAAALQAMKIDERKAEPHLMLANIKLQSGDAAGAIEPFKSAIESNGYDSFGCKNPITAANALSGLGWAQLKANGESPATLTEAVAYQKKAIKAYPHFLPAYIRLAELSDKQNRAKEAESLYKRIFPSTNYNSAVGLPYSQFLAKAKRTDEARTVLKKVLEKSPENKQAADALAALPPG